MSSRAPDMDAIRNRTVTGLTLLVALWVVVYWTWQPRSDRRPVVVLSDVDSTDVTPPMNPQPEPPQVQPQTTSPPPAPETAAQPETEPDFGEPPFRWTTALQDDTFESIAARELGDRNLWRAIAHANPLKDPNRLKPGDRVKIPLDPENPQGRPENGVPEKIGPVEYVVQKDDTLSGIAKQFYGSVTYTDFLYQANRDRLRSKDDLRLGQALVIPPKPPGAG